MTSLDDRWNAFGDLRLGELLFGSSVCQSPFGLTGERLCGYRGITIDDSLHDLTIEAADFSHARMGDGQLMAALCNCKFLGFTCDGTLGESFLSCTFREARLMRAVLYGRFVGCDFTNANLSGVRGCHICFENCTFEATDFGRASLFDCMFRQCKLHACRFGAGSLAGSRFEDCAVIDSDFGNTIMTRVVGVGKESTG